MSSNTFFNFATWVNAEIQSSQLARTNSILQSQLSAVSQVLHAQSLNNDRALKKADDIQAFREIVFTLKKQLSEVLEVLEEQPLEALVFYLNSVQAFVYIDPSLFPSFSDKEYVDEVQRLVSQLEASVFARYDSGLVRAILKYKSIDSVHADLKVRRFFVKAMQLTEDERYRGFMGIKETYVTDLKKYCADRYSDRFWNAYIKYDRPGRVEQCVRSRMKKINEPTAEFQRKIRILEEIELWKNSRAILEMNEEELEALETSILSWLEAKKSDADAIGLALPEPGSLFEDRIDRAQ